jgi:2-keto-3-deoxy-L-rhamnonate aldolase RhmA
MMAVEPTLRRRLADGATVVGTFLNLGSPITAEICGIAGFEWVLVDLEHGAGTAAELIGQLQAVAHTGATPLVRVELTARTNASRALDAGAGGVMFPRIDSAEEARQAISFLRFPPRGVRGVAVQNRAAGFGQVPVADLPMLDESVLGIIQIETLGSLREIEAVVAIDGVDVVFIGPGDLSYALGIPGQLGHPLYREALEAVVAAAARHGRTTGVLVTNLGDAERHVAAGCRFVGIGSDSSMVMSSARATVTGFQEIVDGAQGTPPV